MKVKALYLLSILFLSSFLIGNGLADNPIKKGTLEYNYMIQLAKTMPGYFTIDPKSVEIKQVDFDKKTYLEFLSSNPPSLYNETPELPLDETVFIEKIINLGKQLWKIVVENKPVVNISLDTASAVPAGIKTWQELHSWKDVSATFYQYTCKNLYGVKVIDITFGVSFAHGGQYNNRGRYLANVLVVPAKVEVAWAYTYNMSAEVLQVLNKGSVENPIALMELKVKSTVDTVVKHMELNNLFSFTGEGAFTHHSSN